MSTAEIAIEPTKNIVVPMTRTRVIGGILVGLGVFIIGIFGIGVASNAHSSLTFNPENLSGTAPWNIGTLTLNTRVIDIIIGLVVCAIGGEVIARLPRRGVMFRFSIGAVLFFLTLLIWVARTPGPSGIGFIDITPVLVGTASIATVLIFGSLSGVMCERAGVVNIAIEGQFIAGAFVGSVLASTTSSFWLATLGGLVAGGLIGLALAFFALRYQSDQIIVGVVLVTILSGLSSYLNLQVLTPYPQYNLGNIAPRVTIPLLAKLPILGPVFFNENAYFYAMVILVLIISVALFRTRWGLRVRAVGEHPKAAASVGINVIRVRYRSVVMGGAIAGLGGVAFMAVQGQFQPGYTSGWGYIALAAMIFGRWRPSGAVAACVIFALSLYLATNLQTYRIPIPTEILGMFPYIITIVVVSGLIGRVRAPAADGIPYARD